jgi:serine/threonine protein kinase
LFFRYWNLGILNPGNDVYSFGIILLELITGQLAINNSREGSLLDWVKSKLEMVKLEDIVDNKLQGYKQDSVWRIIEIALSCTTPTLNGRPTMMEVLSKLKECEELNNTHEETSQVVTQSTFDIATTNSISHEMHPLETSQFFNPKAR